MCELFGWSSSGPECRPGLLERFRRRGGTTADHVDGWGIAHVEAGRFRLHKEPLPAVESTAFAPLTRKIETDLLIAHVRKADFPPVRSVANTHPFLHPCCGQEWVFAHNGLVSGMVDAEAGRTDAVCHPDGQTDSEQAFCHLLRHLAGCLAHGGSFDIQPCVDALARASGAMSAWGKFNFLLSEGKNLIAYCHDKLHYLECRGAESRSGSQRFTAVATEPLFNPVRWKRFFPGEMRIYREGRLRRRVVVALAR